MIEEVKHVMSSRAIFILNVAAWSGRGAAEQVFYTVTIQSTVRKAVELLEFAPLRA